jgi:hypothetical protein
VAVAAYFWIQERPAKQGGWLSPEEQRYLVLRNRYGYGAAKSGSNDEFSWKDARSAFKVRRRGRAMIFIMVADDQSIHVWVTSFIIFCVCIAVYGLSFTLPTIMNNMGFSAANAQALSAPPYVFAGFCTVLSGWYSDKYRQRMGAVTIPAAVAFM